MQADNITISNIKLEDSGYFICEASNLLGQVSARVLITVVEALRFEIQPANKTDFIVERVALHCKATGATEVYWTKDSQRLPKSTSSTPAIYQNDTLVIPKLRPNDSGIYVCIARNFQRSIESEPVILISPAKSCSEYKIELPLTPSGNYMINPDGKSPFIVYCDMSVKGGVGVTVISHDSEARTLVNGLEAPGSYSKDVRYTGVTKAQLTALTGVSQDCEQFVKFECRGDVAFMSTGYAWWVSRDNVKQNYWGGAKPGSGKCACGMTNSCQRESGGCNCNNSGTHRDWHSDSGSLTDKSTLPVSQLRLGDTGDEQEMAYHTIGKFKCYGSL